MQENITHPLLLFQVIFLIFKVVPVKALSSFMLLHLFAPDCEQSRRHPHFHHRNQAWGFDCGLESKKKYQNSEIRKSTLLSSGSTLTAMCEPGAGATYGELLRRLGNEKTSNFTICKYRNA